MLVVLHCSRPPHPLMCFDFLHCCVSITRQGSQALVFPCLLEKNWIPCITYNSFMQPTLEKTLHFNYGSLCEEGVMRVLLRLSFCFGCSNLSSCSPFVRLIPCFPFSYSSLWPDLHKRDGSVFLCISFDLPQTICPFRMLKEQEDEKCRTELEFITTNKMSPSSA